MIENLLKKIEGYIEAREFTTINATVPESLFYYAEGLYNGSENKLESRLISIQCEGLDTRDNCQINILIKEDSQSVSPIQKRKRIIHIELPYQIARKMLFDMIKRWKPHYVNLTTK